MRVHDGKGRTGHTCLQDVFTLRLRWDLRRRDEGLEARPALGLAYKPFRDRRREVRTGEERERAVLGCTLLECDPEADGGGRVGVLPEACAG